MNLHEEILKVCLKIAKRGEGAIILVGDSDYKPLVKQHVEPFQVLENPKLLESLALSDGAVIINPNGMMVAYGVMLRVNKLSLLKNFGTRHNTAMSVSSIKDNKVYVVSEEDNKIRIFQKGKLILELDGKEKSIEKRIPEVTKIMESVGWGTTSIIGAGLLAPVIGITIVSGVTVFVTVTGITYAVKKFRDWGWMK